MQPHPERDPALPDTEIYYASRIRAMVSLWVGAGATGLSVAWFFNDTSHSIVLSIIAGFFVLMGSYAVVYEVHALLRPKKHALMIGPAGLTVSKRGRPVLYPWKDIDGFDVASSAQKNGKKPLSDTPTVVFDVQGAPRQVEISELCGWIAQDLVVHLHTKKRKFLKKQKNA